MNIEDVLTEEHFCSRGMCSWLPHVRGEFGRPYARYLREFLCLERRYADELGYCIYPDADQVFRSLQLTPLHGVKVVIVGEDPYYNGQADGLAFSIIGKLPESKPSALKTIFDAINCDNSISGNILLTRQTNSLWQLGETRGVITKFHIDREAWTRWITLWSRVGGIYR